VALIGRTAYPRFVRAVSARELAEVFTLRPTRWSGRAASRRKVHDQLETPREMHRSGSERLLGVFGDVLDGVCEALGPDQHQAGPADTDVPAHTRSGAGGHGQGVAERAGLLVLKALEQGGLDALATGAVGGRIR
jgi:hypothetical protein